MESSEERREKFFVFCPVCGHFFFRCKTSNVEEECDRCKNTIVVNAKDEILTLFRSRRTNERRTRKKKNN